MANKKIKKKRNLHILVAFDKTPYAESTWLCRVVINVSLCLFKTPVITIRGILHLKLRRTNNDDTRVCITILLFYVPWEKINRLVNNFCSWLRSNETFISRVIYKPNILHVNTHDFNTIFSYFNRIVFC